MYSRRKRDGRPVEIGSAWRHGRRWRRTEIWAPRNGWSAAARLRTHWHDQADQCAAREQRGDRPPRRRCAVLILENRWPSCVASSRTVAEKWITCGSIRWIDSWRADECVLEHLKIDPDLHPSARQRRVHPRHRAPEDRRAHNRHDSQSVTDDIGVGRAGLFGEVAHGSVSSRARVRVGPGVVQEFHVAARSAPSHCSRMPPLGMKRLMSSARRTSPLNTASNSRTPNVFAVDEFDAHRRSPDRSTELGGKFSSSSGVKGVEVDRRLARRNSRGPHAGDRAARSPRSTGRVMHRRSPRLSSTPPAVSAPSVAAAERRVA
jgi:hypothetical protein